MTQQPFRLTPALPVQGYQTFELRRPAGGQFWRKATCEEIDCPAFLNGWVTRVPADSPQAEYITSGRSGRQYGEITGEDDEHEGVRAFRFERGQVCFGAANHQIAVEREPLYVVRDGDWRGNPTGRRMVHHNAEDWREDMQESLDKVRQAKERG